MFDHKIYKNKKTILIIGFCTVLTACGGGGGGGSSAPVTDTTPNTFTFVAQSDVQLEETVTSNSVTIESIDTGVNITISGGEYAINGGEFTSASGTVSSGQTVQVRHTASSDFSAEATSTLTVGGMSGTFTSTTRAGDTTPKSFTFTAQADVQLESTVTSSAVTIEEIETAASVSITGGEYAIDGGSYMSAASSVSSGQQVTVRHTSATELATDVDTVLTVGGVSATFTSTTRTIQPLTFITGCKELYGEECTNIDDWTVTLWSDDLTTEVASRSVSNETPTYFFEADGKESVNYSFSGTKSVKDGVRTIWVNTHLGSHVDKTFTTSVGLGFPLPAEAPAGSECETFSLTVNDIPSGTEGGLPLEFYSPNNPHLPVTAERITPTDTDSSQSYSVTSCNNSVLVLLSAYGSAYGEFDTSTVDDGGSASVSLSVSEPVTLTTDADSYNFLARTLFARANYLPSAVFEDVNPIASPYSSSEDLFSFNVSSSAAGSVTYDYQTRETCSTSVGSVCSRSAQSANHATQDAAVSLSYSDFEVTQFDLSNDDTQLDVNWQGQDLPTSISLINVYSGNIDGETVSITHLISFSATTLSTAIPPLPEKYKNWLEEGHITHTLEYIMLYRDESYLGLSFADGMALRHGLEGALSSQNKNNPQNPQPYVRNAIFSGRIK